MSSSGPAPADFARCPGVPSVSRDSTPIIYRRNKGMGGTSRPDRDALSNLIALDPVVHNGCPQSVHARREWSDERGYLVPKHEERAKDFPILLRGVRWVYLTDDGRYLPV